MSNVVCISSLKSTLLKNKNEFTYNCFHLLDFVKTYQIVDVHELCFKYHTYYRNDVVAMVVV